MYSGSIYHGDLIEALRRNIPGCYVRDYRDGNGYITVCRGYRTIPWKGDGLSTQRRYANIPAETLLSVPSGMVQAADIYQGLALQRPGWRKQLREKASLMTHAQRRRIQRDLGVRVWSDIA